MTEPDPVRVALRFVNEINRHDVPALLGLVAPNHVFVDSLGNELRGPERLAASWTGYFELFPDYRIVIDDHFGAGPNVGLFGTASATLHGADATHLPERRWKIPAAWRAVVREARIEHWQVYADNDPVRKILAAVRTAPTE
jgi:ketosteroid isomerase-like protein